MTRILVTGASGFLGQHVVTALAGSGHDIVALSRSGTPLPGAARTIACDLLDQDAMREALEKADAEILVHSAWETDPRARWHSLSNLDWMTASVALARRFGERGGKRFVFVGSCAEYDWNQPLLCEDSTPLRPATLYGSAKAATGIALSGAASALGISLVWARVFFCYGPGEPAGRLVHDLVDGISAGRRVPCTDGLQERDFLHAADIGAALGLLATGSFEGPVNIASGEGTAVKDLITEVAAAAGDPSLVDFGALARPANDPARLVGEVSRLHALGFRRRFDLHDGVRDTVKAMLAKPAS